MFGLSWDKIILILLAALFVLGPERIPVAVRWVMESLRKVRTMAAGAQEELRSQIGPELDELRRQVAELQSLKEFGELRQLRELNPRTMITKNLLGDQFSGGVAGFLGLNGTADGAAAGVANGGGADGVAAANGAASGSAASAANGSAANGSAANGSGAGMNGAAASGPATATAATRVLTAGERPPFDDEGT